MEHGERPFARQQLRTLAQCVPEPARNSAIAACEISVEGLLCQNCLVGFLHLDAATPDLVQGRGPLGSKQGRVLCVAGARKSKRMRLAVMDMWKPLRNSTLKPEHAPQTAIVFDARPSELEVAAEGQQTTEHDLLQDGEQSGLGLREGLEQQDPRHPATELRPTQRRVPALESPHLYAPADLKSGHNHPLADTKSL
jgi:hypothetical protein